MPETYKRPYNINGDSLCIKLKMHKKADHYSSGESGLSIT